MLSVVGGNQVMAIGSIVTIGGHLLLARRSTLYVDGVQVGDWRKI